MKRTERDYDTSNDPPKVLKKATINKLMVRNAFLEKRCDKLEWVNVEDRLPPDCSGYAIRSMQLICNDGFVTVGYWYPSAMKWADNGNKNITSQVTHWMPLPSPPLEENLCKNL